MQNANSKEEYLNSEQLFNLAEQNNPIISLSFPILFPACKLTHDFLYIPAGTVIVVVLLMYGNSWINTHQELCSVLKNPRPWLPILSQSISYPVFLFFPPAAFQLFQHCCLFQWVWLAVIGLKYNSLSVVSFTSRGNWGLVWSNNYFSIHGIYTIFLQNHISSEFDFFLSDLSTVQQVANFLSGCLTEPCS